ncbi:MAG: hypothetical protein ACE366_11335 [Bradymonadia bacterium]
MRHATRLPLAFCALFALGGSGCSIFYDVEESAGVTKTIFDDTLPSSLSEVFEECTEPLIIEGGIDEIDMLGSCTIHDTDSAGADAVVMSLALNGPIDLGASIPRRLYTGTETIDGFSWPMQNCEVDFDFTVRLDKLKMYNLDSAWTNHGGDPALWIDFDFNRWADVVEFKVEHTVDCPSRINEGILRGLFNVAIPSGWRQMEIDGLDLDIWVELYDAGDEVGAELALDIDLTELDTDTYLSDLPISDEVILGALGFSLSNIEDEIEDQLYDALASLPGEVADLINGELPDGHTVCSVSQSGGELTVTTDDPGIMACARVRTWTPDRMIR